MRTPSAVRPLSGANCDNKLLAVCLAEKLNMITNEYCHEVQRGYLSDRSILSSVVEVEHHAASALS